MSGALFLKNEMEPYEFASFRYCVKNWKNYTILFLLTVHKPVLVKQPGIIAEHVLFVAPGYQGTAAQ